MFSKPLYQAEKQIEYQKHVKRLNKINSKRMKSSESNQRDQIKQMHKIRNQSSDFHQHEKNKLLNLENNKILNKIIQISERKDIPLYSTIASHNVPSRKNSALITFENPERKKRQREIIQQNTSLAQRLLTKQSQFDRSKTMKTIQQYETVKKILKNNKRIRLVPVEKSQGIYNFSRISTTQISRADKSSSNISPEDIQNK